MHFRRKVFHFEQLEHRRMLDGNITTAFNSSTGVLTVFGDVASNGVAVYNSSSGVVKLVGLNTTDPNTHVVTPTTINGTPSQFFPGTTNIIFDLNSGLSAINRGDDVIVLTSLTLTGAVNIQAADGNNKFAFGQFDNTGNLVDSAVNSLLGAVTLGTGLIVSMGNGGDTMVANNVTLQGAVGQNLSITGGDGTSTLTLTNVTVSHAASFTDTGELTLDLDHFSAKNLTIVTGVGNDVVTLSNSAIAQKISMTLNLGNDVVNLDTDTAGSLDIFFGGGANQLNTSGTTTIADETTLVSGVDVDTFQLSDFSSHFLTVTMGLGDDSLSLSHVTVAGAASLAGVDGADTITLNDVTANNLTVMGGIGNDNLSLTDVTVNKTATINGGLGADTIGLDTVSATTLNVNLGPGADQLTMTNVTAQKTNIDGSDGADTVTINTLSSSTLSVTLGNGADSITLQNVTITGTATIGGGAGTAVDVFTDSGGNTFGTLNRKNFETVIPS